MNVQAECFNLFALNFRGASDTTVLDEYKCTRRQTYKSTFIEYNRPVNFMFHTF